ncbi:MAG: Na+/H+ antiporter subunit E [Gammaproteobacteria bacterium]|nr:Na+/H+ antiporter subunit E [Gammaproteobacteria bacterium]NNJ83897.1 Na+/H+ antiporter subunit E [Gammaproteobacteria bacterium]
MIINKVRAPIALFAVLFTLWLLLSGTLAIDVLAIGLLVSFAIAFLLRDSSVLYAEPHPTPIAFLAVVLYFFYFLKELVKSNIMVAGIVLTPSMPINPGIVKVRTRLKSRSGRLLLANSITLTPGTLTVELRDEWLYIHWITVESTDIDVVTARIVAGFERYLEVIYG